MSSSCPIASRALEGVLAPLERASGLPREAYVDEAVFAFELERVFRPSWLCIGRESELRLPGDFLVAQVADESVLAVRGTDLKLRAFYNVCRHRGLELVREERGR
ncbi:MAG TPA: Rieske 2Fe-2S domain-containing protein, partial [Polyangiaceae bacterium]|nr:Rieske 2Fe-2S domain-containing protein [Polyangiaceae bacterium]